LIKVAPKIIAKYPRVGFIVVGGGKKMSLLYSLAQEKGVLSHFHFPGVVEFDSIPQYINSFDIGIAFDKVENFERVGNSNQKVRQYIACGKPVIATPGGSEFLEENGLGSVVDTRDPARLCASLLKWLSLTEENKIKHAIKATQFASANLTVEKMLKVRLDFWEHSLSKARTNVSSLQQIR
jgi:glycosyltransferase involved in cell wall biosynthesis